MGSMLLRESSAAANKKVQRNQSMMASEQLVGVMSERNDSGLRRKGEGELSKRGIAIAAAVKLETSLNQDLAAE